VLDHGGDAFVSRLQGDIASAFASGARLLRINGVEPLGAPYLFELIAEAHRVGYEDFHVYTTARPLRDRAFAERLVHALGERYRISVPIYGATAATHDRVVGRAGAFDEVLAAFHNVSALQSNPAELTATTVLCHDNASELADIGTLVRRFTPYWSVHLPFPSQSGIGDPYRRTALRHASVLDAAYPTGAEVAAEVALGEVPLCVAFDHMKRSGHDLFDDSRLALRERELSGTRYLSEDEFAHSLGGSGVDVFNAATVPCPHLSDCALAKLCPGKVYALYEELYGLDELHPITAPQLPPGSALAAHAS